MSMNFINEKIIHISIVRTMEMYYSNLNVYDDHNVEASEKPRKYCISKHWNENEKWFGNTYMGLSWHWICWESMVNQNCSHEWMMDKMHRMMSASHRSPPKKSYCAERMQQAAFGVPVHWHAVGDHFDYVLKSACLASLHQSYGGCYRWVIPL